MRRFFALALLAAACGGGSSKHSDGGGGGDDVDSPPGSGNCATTTAMVSYGTITPVQQLATADSTTAPTQEEYDAKLGSETAFDVLGIELYKGSGVFAAGLSPMSVTIGGDEAQYATCGACVLIRTDIHDDGQGNAIETDDYMAKSGTLNLTSVSGNFTGTLTNAVLTHVTIAETTFMSTPVGDCDVTVDSLTFTAPITMAMTGG